MRFLAVPPLPSHGLRHAAAEARQAQRGAHCLQHGEGADDNVGIQAASVVQLRCTVSIAATAR